MSFLDSHALSLLVFLPLATGLVLACARGGRDLLWRGIGLASSTATFALALHCFRLFEPVRTGYQLKEHLPWVPKLGIHYYVGIDGISLLLVVLTALLVPLVLLASWSERRQAIRGYVACLLLIEGGLLGAFVSLNLFLFIVFAEALLIPVFVSIGIWGGEGRVHAAVKFFLFSTLGSLLLTMAVFVLYALHHEAFGVWTLDLVPAPGGGSRGLLETVVPVTDAPWWQTQHVLFAAFAAAFAIQAALVPLHTWLPDAHTEAPTGTSVMLAAAVLKLGAYGLLRFALPLFPAAALDFAPWILGLSVLAIGYGGGVALVQADFKRLVAYTSLSHMGAVLIGIFAFNLEGMKGGVLHLANHGLFTAGLFLLVGMLAERRGTRSLDDFGGVARPMPVFAALCTAFALASIGLPALNGFVSGFLILLGAFLASPWLAAAAATGSLLLAAAVTWALRRVLFGPVDVPENRGLIDLDRRERTLLVVLLIPIVWIGVAPGTFLRRLDASVIPVLERVEQERAARAARETPAEPEDPDAAGAGGAQ